MQLTLLHPMEVLRGHLVMPINNATVPQLLPPSFSLPHFKPPNHWQESSLINTALFQPCPPWRSVTYA